MFIRKLFKIGDKVKWLFLELLIVFIGVYLAFLLQSYAEGKKMYKEKEKVLVGLKLELEVFRTSFNSFADFQKVKVDEWDSLFALEKVASYYNWRYIEPQYNFMIIEYALDQKGTDIVNFDLYDKISMLYGEIKKLEHVERLMTNLGMRYNLISGSLDENSQEALNMKAENRFTFFKFKGFASDRVGMLRRVASASSEILEEINEQLGPTKTREVDAMLVEKYYSGGVELDFIRELFEEYFPQYSSEDFDAFVSKIEVLKEGDVSK